MIVESAFLKLSEIVLNAYSFTDEENEKVCEATLSGFFAISVSQELSSKCVQNATYRIQMEKPYPDDSSKKCDLYIDLEGIYPTNLEMQLINLGFFRKNYLEVKFFVNSRVAKGDPTKSANVGKVLNDLARLNSTSQDYGDLIKIVEL